MAYIKQFLTKTKPSDTTSIFRYSPSINSEDLEIYALISISNGVEVDTSRFTKFVWDGFIDGFLQKDEDIINRLKNSLAASEFKLKHLIKHDHALEERGVSLDLSVVVFKGDKIYVALLGDHKLLLYKKKIIDISELLIQNKSNTGSMVMDKGDMLLMYFSDKKFDKSFKEEWELDEFLSEVFDNDLAKGGAILAMLEQQRKEEVDKVIENIDEGLNEEEQKEQEEIQEEIVEEGEKHDEVKEKKRFGFGILKNKCKDCFKSVSPKVKNISSKIKEKTQKTPQMRQVGNVRPMKVGGYKEKEVKVQRFVLLGIFLLLFIILFFGIKSAFDSKESRLLNIEINNLIEGLDEKVEKARDSNVDEALKILIGVRKDFDGYVLELDEKDRREKVLEEDLEKLDEFESKIGKVEDRVLKIVPVSHDEGNLELFLDAKISFGEKSNPVSMTITKPGQFGMGEYIYVADQGEKAVFEVCVNTSQVRRVADPDNLLVRPEYLDMGNDPANRGLYVYDSEVGVLVAREDENGDLNNFKALSGLSARALGGEKIKAMAVFGNNDTLNFLIPSDSRIIRSQSFGVDNYALPGEYIVYPGFEEGFALFGDQYIYALTRITDGIKRFVPLTGLSSQLAFSDLYHNMQLSAGYTGNTMDRAFVVFDINTNRLIYFEKPIEIGENLRHPGSLLLLAQFEYRGDRGDVFKDIRSLVIEYTDERMFVLDSMKIWNINIVLN